MNSKTLYRREIMELYSERQNFGNLENPTHKIKQKNPACSDEIILEISIDKKTRQIDDAKFHGKTCFISTISASVLLEKIKGLTLEETKKITQRDLDKFLGTPIISTRIKCQLLPLEALRKIR